MFLKITSLGHKEIMDGNLDDIITRVKQGDSRSQATFLKIAKAHYQDLITRAKAGDSTAQKELDTIDRNLPLAKKVDSSLLG